MAELSASERLSNMAWPASLLQSCVSMALGWDKVVGASVRVSGETSVPSVAQALDLQARELDCSYPELNAMLEALGPAVLELPGRGYFAMRACGRGQARLLGPSGEIGLFPVELIAAQLTSPIEGPVAALADEISASLSKSPRARQKARQGLLDAWLRRVRVPGVWTFELPPHRGLLRQLWRDGSVRSFSSAVSLQFLATAALAASWFVLARALLLGYPDQGWMWAWGLCLLSGPVLKAAAGLHQTRFTLGVLRMLRRRLLNGALRAPEELIKKLGLGGAVTRSLEGQSLFASLLGGVGAALSGPFQLLAGSLALIESGGLGVAALLGFWSVVLLLLGLCYARALKQATLSRIELTIDFVEKLVGQRTRQIQQAAGSWHAEEDERLAQYSQHIRGADRLYLTMGIVAGRGWSALGAALLALVGLQAGVAPTAVALMVGGVVLTGGGLSAIAVAFTELAAARVSWSLLAPLLHAGSEGGERSEVETREVSSSDHESVDPLVVQCRNLSFKYDSGSEVLSRLDLLIHRGEKLVLTGQSGSGKSTLLSILGGELSPTSGLVLARGYDRSVLGMDGWRSFVSSAAQMERNRIFPGTLAYNLLMGRTWPAAAEDLQAAEALCHELGLGDLLKRMPSGLQQIVGETGWSLSHGEQARVFMARALLTRADLVLLDESLSALDPESAELCMNAAARHPAAVVVAAHP